MNLERLFQPEHESHSSEKADGRRGIEEDFKLVKLSEFQFHDRDENARHACHQGEQGQGNSFGLVMNIVDQERTPSESRGARCDTTPTEEQSRED